MPQYFHFHAEDGPWWNAQLTSKQCTFIKPDGDRCRNMVAKSLPCCRIHLIKQYFLVIKPSTIPQAGMGLFVHKEGVGNNDIVFRKGDTIVPYQGETLDRQQLLNRYGDKTAPYGLQVKNNVYIDAATERGAGAAANRRANANARLTVNTRANSGSLQANKNIRQGDEIFVAYGNTYRMHDEAVAHATNNKKYNI